MDDDKIPLSPTRAPQVVVDTRAKFDSLLDDALSKKNRSRSRRRAKKTLKKLDESPIDSTDSPSTTIEIDEFPRPAPRRVISPIRTHRRRSKSSLNIENNGEENPALVEEDNDDPIEPIKSSLSRRSSVASRRELNLSTIINIQDDEETDSLSQAETSFSTGKRRSIKTLPPLTQSAVVSIEPTNTQQKTKKKSKKLKAKEIIELKTSPVKPPRTPSHKSEETSERLSVTLHGCQIPTTIVPRSISIRVHVIDIDSGRELFTSEQMSVASQTTEQVFDIRGKFATIEKNVIFPASLQIALENSVVLFFELLVPEKQTFNSFSCYSRLESEERCIGWSFLKLKGANNHINCDEKVRLHIYEPLATFRRQTSQDFKLVHSWWCRGPWKKTLCSLYVTVQGMLPPGLASPSSDKNKITAEDDVNEEEQLTKSPAHESLLSDLAPDWLRSSGQLCKVTSQVHMSLPTRTSSCLALAFSHSGNLLACAASQNIIYLYQLPAFKELCSLVGHQGLIYDLSWLSDKFLLSASADCTVILWNIKKQQIYKVLPHPTFVYSCQFLSDDQGRNVITGSKDQIIRVWCQQQSTKEFDLWQELEGHEGFVTSLCVNQSGHLFSADSEGCILMWNKSSQNDWQQVKELVVSGLKGTSISSISAHPAGTRLLVHARDSLVRLVDIASGAVVQHYTGALSHKVQTGACVSPCGSLVIAGGEEGSVSTWQTETGSLLSHCEPPSSVSPSVTAVAYHPHAHLMATGYFGHPNLPVKIWIHDAELTTANQFKRVIRPDVNATIESISMPASDQLHLQDIIARIDQVLTFTSKN